MQEQIYEELKKATKAGDHDRKAALRSILSTLKNLDNDLDQEQYENALLKLAKQHNDSIEQYRKANRDDLVKQEEKQLAVVNEFLPEQMSNEEIDEEVNKVINDIQAQTMKDMGNVMQEAQNRIGAKADKQTIGKIAKQKLQ